MKSVFSVTRAPLSGVSHLPAQPTKSPFVRFPLVALAIIAGFGISDARAASKEFTNGDTSAPLSLSDGNNYTPSGLPGSGDNIVLDTVGGSLTLSASSLNIEDINYTVATTTNIYNSTTGTTASTLTLNGGRGSSVPLFEQNSTKNFTIKNGSTGALNLLLGSSGAFDIANTGNLTVSSNIGEVSSGTSLMITNASGAGTGTVTLSGTNSFSGGLVALGGEVDVASDSSLGATNGSLTVNGGRIAITASGTISSSRAIYVGANPTGNNTLSTFSTSGSGTTVVYNGSFQNVSGSAGDFVKQGGGTLQLGGTSTYSGSTFINNGIVQLTTSDNRLPTGTTVSIGQAGIAGSTKSANTGELDLNSFNQTITGLNSTAYVGSGTLTAQNTLTSSSGAATLTLAGTGTYAYGDGSVNNSGAITGALSINKTSSGVQTFGGPNTYSGTTTIGTGTLFVSNATGSATGMGNVTIGTSGTLASGAGSIGIITGLVTTASKTSVVAPGITVTSAVGSSGQGTVSTTGTVGALTLKGGLNISAGATIPFDLGITGGTDLITVSGGTFTGAATAGSDVFNFNTSGTSGTYTLINYSGATASGIATSDFSETGASGYFTVTSSLVEFTIVAAPEPSTVFGGALIAGVLGLSQRRRIGRWLAFSRVRGSRRAA